MDNKDKTLVVKEKKTDIMIAYKYDAFFNTAVYNKRLTFDKYNKEHFFSLKLEPDMELIIKLDKYTIIWF